MASLRILQGNYKGARKYENDKNTKGSDQGVQRRPGRAMIFWRPAIRSALPAMVPSSRLTVLVLSRAASLKIAWWSLTTERGIHGGSSNLKCKGV